jgi:hypothetical protein
MGMELQPSEPPGHAKRKLRGYVSEISRLRAEGYTIRAIHRAFIDAGMVVSWATVQREAARLNRTTSTAKPRELANSPTDKRSAAPAQPVGPVGGKKAAADEVEAYFTQQHNNNPLFKKKARQP